MSCLRQRRFANPIKDENRTGYDKYTITGNCGSCAACNKRKQNDWLVRSYFEYLSKDYDGFFVTFDFDDEHLPTYKGSPCFDSKLMSDYFDRLHHVLPDFRYLYSSHFGEALNRPHYHVAFLFERGSISQDRFFDIIHSTWKNGSHSRIDLLRSVKSNPFAAFEYICKYTTRNTKFLWRANQMKMPARFRPRTYASIGFGAQAMDPSEIRSDRLLKEGIKFLDRPIITRKYIQENSLIYLDIKQDGVLVPFAIPRYYELKLCFDTSYDSQTKRTTLLKNETGKALQEIRHNVNYLNLYSEFVNSRHIRIHLDDYVSTIYHEVFPSSPYNGVAWSDVVDDVLIDKDKFFDFCKYYSWLEFDLSKPGYYRYRPLRFDSHHPLPAKTKTYDSKVFSFKDCTFHAASLDGSFAEVFDDDIDLYIYAISYFQIWKDVMRYRKAEFEDWKAQEQTKAKIKEKCKSNLSYYWHLRRSNFKFYTLNPKSYVSRYQTRKNRVLE